MDLALTALNMAPTSGACAVSFTSPSKNGRICNNEQCNIAGSAAAHPTPRAGQREENARVHVHIEQIRAGCAHSGVEKVERAEKQAGCQGDEHAQNQQPLEHRDDPGHLQCHAMANTLEFTHTTWLSDECTRWR